MDSDLCLPGVLRVVSCSGLLCSWKPVLRDILPALIPSCCVYGCWSVLSWCSSCCVLFQLVVFLETSVERPACFCPVLLCLFLLLCAVLMFWVLYPVPACCVPGNQCLETSCLLQSHPVVYMASDPCRPGVFWVLCDLCPVPACFVPGNQCLETACLLQCRPVIYLASDLCCRGVLSVVSCSGLFCFWKPVLRDLLPASVPSCCVYGFWSVPLGVLSVVSCSGQLCSWKPVLRDLPASVLSCCVCVFWIVPSGCFECCVLFRSVLFLETSVQRPPDCFSLILFCIWLLICAVGVFCVLWPVPTCCIPRNQCWETSCLLQSRPVVYMASDLCRPGVLSVLWLVSCFGLLCSWKPVLRYLPASVPSCCVYGFRSVPSWCFECCVLCQPVVFLETSDERLLPASIHSWCFEYYVLFQPAEWLHICWPHGELWWNKSINRTIWEYLCSLKFMLKDFMSAGPRGHLWWKIILFYSILFYSILFYSILFCSILFYITKCLYTIVSHPEHQWTLTHTQVMCSAHSFDQLEFRTYSYSVIRKQ